MTLDKAEKGKKYEIVDFEDRVMKRFFELGFTKGQIVEVVAKSVLKKAYLVEIRGFLLSVRASLLKDIVVMEILK